MSAPSASRLLRQAAQHIPRSPIRHHHSLRRSIIPASRSTTLSSPSPSNTSPILPRSIYTSTTNRAGLMPDTQDPQPPSNEPHDRTLQPAALDDDTYHELADAFMNAVYEKAEALQETREDVDVDYSAGVLAITFPPNGEYVLNKQPPNRQIWISSPVSGPKRYDWVVAGEGMHQKEGAGAGEWVYVRDGSRLTDLLTKELGLSVDPAEEELKESRDARE